MKEKILHFRTLAMECLRKTPWLPALLTRLTVGWVFIESGWGKLHNIPKVVEFFTALGIPAANLQAPFVAGTEFFCGLLLFFGLFSRLAAIPLSATMVVALLTAKKADITVLSDLFGFSEYLYILLLMWVIFEGPGIVSADHWLLRRMTRRTH